MTEDKITFVTDDGVEVCFTVIEEAKLSGVNYLLVSLEGDEEDEAYILTEVKNEDGELVYEMLEDESKLPIILDYFNAIVEDIDLEI